MKDNSITRETIEDVAVERVSVMQLLDQFDSEIQLILRQIFLDDLMQELPDVKRLNMHQILMEQLKRVKSPRDQKIVLLRFGLITGSPVCSDEIVSRFGITKQKLSEIEKLFLRRPERFKRRKRIRDYLEERA